MGHGGHGHGHGHGHLAHGHGHGHLAHGHGHGHGHSYQGHYAGHCHTDGVYVDGPHSLILCSNGIGYHQHCAPGTANSGNNHQHVGSYYNLDVFCDINLVALGHGPYG